MKEPMNKHNHLKKFHTIGTISGIILLVSTLSYLFLIDNMSFTTRYTMSDNTKQLSQLGPNDRIEAVTDNSTPATKMIHDLIYFTTIMKFHYDTAKVAVTFKNENKDQDFFVGYHNDETWHYADKPYDIPFITELSWQSIGTDPLLYQKESTYSSIDEFLNHPPKNAVIGTYAVDNEIESTKETRIPDYKPSQTETVINTPLRGRQVMYVYLDKEPFNMTIEKQDLNWYEDPDPVTVKIYKKNDLMYQVTADDDGITNASHRILPPQEINIQNPEKKYPESGVYKIIIDAGGDTLIKRIKTNLHKIVFKGSIFLAGNHEAYPDAIAKTTPTTLYTNASILSAITYHSAGLQTLLIKNTPIAVDKVKYLFGASITEGDINTIVIPGNDIILNAFQDYFTFSPDQFFLPTTYNIVLMRSIEDAKRVDYILTPYKPPHTDENGWQVNEYTFDLSDAYIKNNKLNWLIKAPHLKENDNSIIIKDITVTLHKKGLF